MVSMRGLMFAGAVMMTGALAVANTPDGSTPAQEVGCDRLSGAEYGLCVAYCEAMDCDDAANADDEACDAVFDNFTDLTGTTMPTCADGGTGGGGDTCNEGCAGRLHDALVRCKGDGGGVGEVLRPGGGSFDTKPGPGGNNVEACFARALSRYDDCSLRCEDEVAK